MFLNYTYHYKANQFNPFFQQDQEAEPHGHIS